MVITRTPFRISFFGGGTDFPAWYRDNSGSVLSTTIDKYCYITCRNLPPFFEHKHRIVYSKIENVIKVDEIMHPAVRETLKFLKIEKGIEIHHDGDLPARSGIGSSSSFTVGLLNALYALQGQMVSKKQLALNSIFIEQEMIKENVGSQDQVSVAYGGFNRIDFYGNHNIQVSPVIIPNDRLDELQKHCLLFFTGLSRTASEIEGEKILKINEMKSELKTLQSMVEQAIEILAIPSMNILEFGKLLNEGWRIKKRFSNKVSSSFIDDLYVAGCSTGAVGGKVLGAGGGGFILFFASPESHQRIIHKFSHLLHVPFRFDTLGSHIIYYRNQYD